MWSIWKASQLKDWTRKATGLTIFIYDSRAAMIDCAISTPIAIDDVTPDKCRIHFPTDGLSPQKLVEMKRNRYEN